MDFGIDLFAGVATMVGEVAAAIARLVAALVVGFVELIILVIEMALVLVGYFWSTQKGQAKLSENSRFTLRLWIYGLLTMVALGAVVYFFGFKTSRVQAPTPPPSKIEKARRVVEKIKEMLPPKSPP